MTHLDLHEKWMSFLAINGQSISYPVPKDEYIAVDDKPEENEYTEDIISSAEHVVTHKYDLLISTKTKVLFLNSAIDINNIFWKIPIVEYHIPEDGVIKKQMKIVSKTPEEFDEYKLKLENIGFYTENVIKQINNPAARSIKFKDERKNAFYNCFALIIRFKFENVFKEIHVKIFNTGKMEIPGVVDNKIFEIVKTMVIEILNKNSPIPEPDKIPLSFVNNLTTDHVLINSNFNCGFCIRRDCLHSIIMSQKYEIESSYDPCSYPGVKCKYYFNNEIGFDVENQKGVISKEDANLKLSQLCENKKYTEVSFMLFRTGSCLIVGNCSERVLRFIFRFIQKFLTDEYENICVPNEYPVDKKKVKKIRKKNATFTNTYYKEVRGTVTV
jgi:hypothetical protein